jgi:hypothetical protein
MMLEETRKRDGGATPWITPNGLIWKIFTCSLPLDSGTKARYHIKLGFFSHCIPVISPYFQLCPDYWYYPLVNVYIAMERSTIFHGKIHYFDWAIFNSYFEITRGYQDVLLIFSSPHDSFASMLMSLFKSTLFFCSRSPVVGC